ncbi:MAG: AraC family transcriptional regulator [Chloroflexi bacterium]|nr:AraC family transcriptional regulator [Chloroflexota bacterium]
MNRKPREFFFEHRQSDSPLVAFVWRAESEHVTPFVSQAASQWEMVISKYQGMHTLTLRGPETKAKPVEGPADAEFFGIAFHMGVFMPHLPAVDLVDSERTLPEASGGDVWFAGSAWELPTFDNADTFIQRLVHDGLLMRDPVVPAALDGRPTYLSPRALQYRFLRATGMTHTTIRQIERARRAAALLGRGASILDTMHETGYFDQAHLTRSLKRFMGYTPSRLLELPPTQVAWVDQSA